MRCNEFYTLVLIGEKTTLHVESSVVLPMGLDDAESFIRANYYGMNALHPETDTHFQQCWQTIP